MLDRLSGVMIVVAPVEDLVWFFAAGLLLGHVYAYWTGQKYALGKH